MKTFAKKLSMQQAILDYETEAQIQGFILG